MPFAQNAVPEAAVPGLEPLGGLVARLDLDRLLDQRGRLIQMACALPALALVPERMVLHEAVDAPDELTLDALSMDAGLELQRLIGEEITIRLLQADGSRRPWHGYVFEATHLGSDGGLARYRLVARTWLGLLALRRDAFIWQDRTATDILADVFRDYPQADVRFDLATALRVRPVCTQYRETDLAFVSRLLAEEGLSTWFEHSEQDDDAVPDVARDAVGAEADGAPLIRQRHARHRLVIGDRDAVREHLGPARFTAQHVTARLDGQRDSVTAFHATRQVTPRAVTLGAWSARLVSGVAGQASAPGADEDLPVFEHYDGSGADRYPQAGDAQDAAARRLAALSQPAHTYRGAGSTRHFTAGRRFTLTDHFDRTGPLGSALRAGSSTDAGADRPDTFTLVRVEHHAANNLGAAAAQALRLTDLENGTYRNRFHALPADTPLVPAPIAKPTAPGMQVAVVVGLPDTAVTTDRDHRVHIQMPWQRGERPLAGGLAHASVGDATGHAPGQASGSAPVRIALPAAGADSGAVLVPRNGTEVAVAAVDGDIDHWIVVGQLYNGQDLPPYPAGESSGANHPGVLSGLRTRQIDGDGLNEWVLDDATGQLRMRLASTGTRSELALGHLIQQSEGSADRAGWLGTGFTATTARWASVRAGNGLLLTTAARGGTYGSAEGTQMDAAEALGQIRAAAGIGQRLDRAAQAATGLGLAAFGHDAEVAGFIDALDPAASGRHPAEVHGQRACKSIGRADGDPVEALAAPLIVLDATAAAGLVSPASIASYAGQSLAMASQGDLHTTATRSYAAVSGGTSALYSHAGGVKVVAANGPVSLRAHSGDLQLLADEDLTVVCVNGEISIQAASRIELVSGASSVVLDGGDVTFSTPGTFEVKHSTHALLGAEARPAPPLRLPDDAA